MPEAVEFSEELLNQLQVPSGFQIQVFAKLDGSPRMMVVAEDGSVYITRRDPGDVLRLVDADGDGVAESQETIVSDLDMVHGIAIHDGKLWLAGVKSIWSAPLEDDGTIGDLETIVDDLPDGGQHANRTIAFDDNGLLYVSIGSTCNDCPETNPENATIVRMKPDGTERTVFASGLRNTIGWAWHPETGDLWGMDQGSDWRGDDQPPEELNKLEMNGNYGWPFCFGEKWVDKYLPREPEGMTKAEFCAASIAPAMMYQAHSSPIGFVFYTGSLFPDEYQGDAFVAFRGSWNRNQPTGYKVVRFRFENGQPVAFEDFVTGFLINGGANHFARIAGLAVAKDGSLLISDDTNGVIYRISYTG